MYKNVALMVTHILADIINYKNINYLNISNFNYPAECAPVALMVKHSSNKRGPSRHLGSIPSWGGAALF